MHGFVDFIGPDRIKGWCEKNVEILIDRRFVLEPDCYDNRPDIAEAGNVGQGFEINIPQVLPGYTPVEIVVRPKGNLHPLPGGYLKMGELRPFQYVKSDRIARLHNERLMAGAVRGICLFTSRSGGTMLTDLISSHPRAYGFAEPIEGFVRGGKSAFSEWLEDFFIIPSLIEYPHKVIDPALMFITTKIKKYDADLFPMFNRYNVKYLRLYRENIVKQAVSSIIAKKLYSENWNFNIKKQDKKTNKINRKLIYVDPIGLYQKIDLYQDAEKLVDDMIAKHAEGDVMSISYEQLVSGDVGIRKVLEYFGLESQVLTSNHVKINSDDLCDVIENFDEVYSFLHKTRYSHFI